MPDADDILETIAQTATDGISYVQIAGQQVTTLSISDQIKAETHVRERATADDAVTTGKRGLIFTKLVPDGCG